MDEEAALRCSLIVCTTIFSGKTLVVRLIALMKLDWASALNLSFEIGRAMLNVTNDAKLHAEDEFVPLFANEPDGQGWAVIAPPGQ